MESVLVARKRARTPFEHCRGTLKQGMEPLNAYVGLCDELLTHSGAFPASTICSWDRHPSLIQKVDNKAP